MHARIDLAAPQVTRRARLREGRPHPRGATWTGLGVNLRTLFGARHQSRAVPIRRPRRARDRTHRTARIHRRGLAWLSAGRAPGNDLRLSRARALRAGQGPPFQSEQAAARSIRKGRRRKSRMESSRIRLQAGNRRRPDLRRTRQRAFHAALPRDRSRLHVGRRSRAAHGLGADGHLRACMCAATPSCIPRCPRALRGPIAA